MTTTHEPKHLREDDAEPCRVLAEALERRASGSTQVRAANEEEAR
jgi:hypothetical protein